MNKNKVHIFPKGDRTVASSRYRAYYLGEKLLEKGLGVEVHKPPKTYSLFQFNLNRFKDIWKYLKFFNRLNKNDIVISQRTIFQLDFALMLVLFKKLGRFKLVFDFDDAVYEHTKGLTDLLIKNADWVTTGGVMVDEYAMKLNKNTTIIRSSLPMKTYKAKSKFTNQVPVVGWVGDIRVHRDNLFSITGALKDTYNKKRYKLRLIGVGKSDKVIKPLVKIFGADLETKIIDDWSNSERVVAEIRKFDVGIMPLTDTVINRAKYFKLLEYMACGVPAIVSDLGEAKYIIRDGDNGMLARSVEDWRNKLSKLLESNSARKEMGRSGRDQVEVNYSIKAAADKMAEVINKVYE